MKQLGLMVALVMVALVACGCAKENASSEAADMTADLEASVSRGALEKRVLLTGELDAVRSVDVVVPRTKTWQLTISWLVEDGTAVKKGDRLVEFDNSAFTSQLESQRVLAKQAKRDYATGQHLRAMSVADAEHKLKLAELAHDKAALVAKVARDLISERDYQERQLALDRTEAAVLTARADLESVRRSSDLDLKIKRIASEKAARAIANAEESIKILSITASEDGVAMVSNHPWMGTIIASGDTVQPGWTIVRLPDLSQMVIRATLSDVDDGELTTNMSADIVFDADPGRTAKGTVERISAVAQGTERGELLRAFDVEVVLEAATGEWARPGMSARVEVLAKKLDDALLVPRSAIDWNAETTSVELASGSVVEVSVDVCDHHQCAITASSPELTAGAALLAQGSR